MTDEVLAGFGLSGPPMGEGGEAQVWALDAGHVLRVYRGGGFADETERRRDLHALLAPGARAAGIAIPEIVETGQIAGQFWTIETRLPGRPLSEVLAGPCDRAALITGYMETAGRLGDLLSGPEHRELCNPAPLSDRDGRTFLHKLAERSLDASPFDIAVPDPGLGDAPAELVHLDYYPTNIMAEPDRITGVLDFGYAAFLGDRRLTPLCAALALDPRVAPDATPADRDLAQEWLARNDLVCFVRGMRRWIAAYWAFAVTDDSALARWVPTFLDETNED